MDKKGNGSHWLTRTVSVGETVFVFCLLVVALVTAGYYGMHGNFLNFASVETASPLTLGAAQNGTRIQASGTKSTGGKANIIIYVAPAGQPIGPNTGTGITTVVNAPDGAWKSNYIDGYLTKTGVQPFVPGTSYVIEAMVGSQSVTATVAFSASGTPAASTGSTGSTDGSTSTPPPTTGDHPVTTTPPPTPTPPVTTPPVTTPPVTTPPVTTPPAPTGLTVGAKVYTTTGGVNVRSAANTSASIVTQVAANAVGTIVASPTTGTGFVWYQVQFGEKTGWVAATYLSATPGGVAVTPPVTIPPVTTPPVTTPPVTTRPVTTPPVTTPPVIPTAGIVFIPAVPQPSGNQIVGGLLQAGATALPAHAISFGQSFHSGSVPGSSGISATVNGAPVPAQLDVETTNPDGSARFGVVTIMAPSIQANTSVPFMLSLAAKSGNAITLSSMPGYDANVSINVTAGGSGSYNLDAASLLQKALAAGTVSYWRQGPVVTEARIDSPVLSSLHVTFDIAKYADGSYSTDVQFNNDYAMQPVGGELTYDVSISQLGSSVFSRVNVPQIQYTTWHKQIWSNGAPGINVVHDVDYLERTHALPDYDLTTGLSGAVLTGYAQAMASGKGFDILGNATLATYMGTTGGRPDIGFTTEANADWLVTQNPTAAAFALAQADAAGTVPWHFYVPTTGKYLDAITYPKIWVDSRGAPNTLTQPIYAPGPAAAATDPFCQRASPAGCFDPDFSHQPDFAYVPFLLTGLRYYGDQQAAQASGNVMYSAPANQYRQGALGLVANNQTQVRGRGWSLREIVEAAFITPDKDPLHSYFSQILANNIAYLTNQANTVEKPNQGAVYGWVGGYSMGPYGPGELAPWQQEYLYYSVLLAAKQGVAGAASYLTTFMNNFMIDRWVASAAGFSPYDADDYNITVASNSSQNPSTYYTTWAQVEAGGIANKSGNGSSANFANQFRLTYLTSRSVIAEALNLGMDTANAQSALNWIATNYTALDVPFIQSGNERFNLFVRPGGSLGVANTNSNLAAAETAPVPHHFWASIMDFFLAIGKFLGLA